MQIGSVQEMTAAIIVIISSYTDLRWHKIYNWLTIPAMLIGIIYNLFVLESSEFRLILYGLILFVLIALIHGLSKETFLGGGDIKLLGVVGVYCGFFIVLDVTIIFASIIILLWFLYPVKIQILKEIPFSLIIALSYFIILFFHSF